MSSYLPLRHTGTHGVPPAPRGAVGGEDGVMHGMGGVMDGGGYMEHFLNIPEICPTGSYRNPRYYMGTYNAEACRMEALQQQHRNHHDLRMGLQGARPSFYPNMNMGMRFADSMDTQVGANCIPPQNRAETLSPCTKAVGVASDVEPPSFYPWMSINCRKRLESKGALRVGSAVTFGRRKGGKGPGGAERGGGAWENIPMSPNKQH
ncbi:unnamed protein product [Candidula unifasciata]|uniref:Uncharacterized protein n=1 Tax=Candidula unifasciata TaxID=100452 RepID=A0A8S3ZDW2_9EUPU|nr:unnamed protein product [Candidula unifasciata]